MPHTVGASACSSPACGPGAPGAERPLQLQPPPSRPKPRECSSVNQLTVVGRQRDLQFVYEPVQGRARDLERARRLQLVVAELDQRTLDEPPLEAPHLILKRTVTFDLPGAELRGQVFNVQFR